MNSQQIERDLFVKEIKEKYPDNYQMGLKFGDLGVTVSANDKDIIKGLKAYFNGFVVEDKPVFKGDSIHVSAHEGAPPMFDFPFAIKQPDPGKEKIKEEWSDLKDGRVVRKKLTGMTYVFGRSENGSVDNVVVGPCLKNLNQVINFINNRHIEWALCRGCVLGHAAGIILNGKGIAMAGFSGAGKSTFALHMMSKGATFVSNDRLMVEKTAKGLRMHGVAKLPRINPGTILNNENLSNLISDEEKEEFRELSMEELWKLEQKYDAPIDTCFGENRFALSWPMHGLIILNWKHNGGPLVVNEVDPAKRQDLLPAFMKETGLFFWPETRCDKPDYLKETYVDFLKRCRMWEFSGGIDFEKATAACIELVAV